MKIKTTKKMMKKMTKKNNLIEETKKVLYKEAIVVNQKAYDAGFELEQIGRILLDLAQDKLDKKIDKRVNKLVAEINKVSNKWLKVLIRIDR